MTYLDRIAVSLLLVVTFVAVLIRVTACSGLAGAPQPSASESSPVVGTVIISGDAVNLRQEPARSASVLAQAERGQELELLGTQEDWYNVRWSGGTAWLSKLYASPIEDCPTEQAASSEDLRRWLPGEWKGEMSGRPATFVFYTRGERLCAYVLQADVKEVFTVAETGWGTLTLTGKRFERLAGTTGEYWLDTLSGRLEDPSGRLSGTYVDTRSSRGEWFAVRPGSASEAAPASIDDDEAQMATQQPEAEIPGSPDLGDAPTAPVPIANQSEAEPQEETIASAPESGLVRTESSFIGHWEGEGKQLRQRWRIQMKITSESPGRVVGSIQYPSLRCGGDLVLTEVRESTWTMREDITYGSNCITGGSITMASTGPNRAQWLWYYPQGGLGAQGEVRRQAE